MSLRVRILHLVGNATLLVGMAAAFPGCMLILAGSWCTDEANSQGRDHEPGRF
jgi:hypothetical protein